MTCLTNLAFTAILLIAMLFYPPLGDRCQAQSRAAARTTGSKPIARSPRPTKKPLERINTPHHPVRTASTTQYASTLAPTAMNGAHEPSALMKSQTEPSDGRSIGDQATDCSGCDNVGEHDACRIMPTGYLFDWTRAELWAGAVAFTVPANFLGSASNPGASEGCFGFQEGINFGSRVPSLLCGQMGSQLGLRFVHSQLDGSAAGVDHRQQLFLTTGLFRRVDYGVQGGVVIDYLHDDWIYKADLLQLRGELSYLMSPCHELGFRFTNSQQIDDTSYRLRGNVASTNVRITSLDSYRGFYRFRFSEQARGQAELQAGWTGDSGAILGLTLHTPLQSQVGLTTNATYLVPPNAASPSYAFEGWNIGIALVWTPGRQFGLARDYYRPLFEVADNGTLISKID